MKYWGGALIWVLMGSVVLASPGQCSTSEAGSFACEVVLDGNGLTFALPSGDMLAFTSGADDEGEAFLIARDSAPGQRPRDLGTFSPVANQPGCWASADDFQFCAMIEQ